MNWLLFALMTVACWGVYGIFLHKGAVGMGDPENGRYKAFLFVGIAYFLVAIVAPLAVLIAKGASWQYPGPGMKWSLIAGIVGALGAFGVLLAFGAKGSPAVVMSIIFAGAPVINAVVAIAIDPKIHWSSVPLPFYVGIALAAAGGCIVTLYKPVHVPEKKPQAEVVHKAE
jgi:drug/metabolite transporter (DMT)-like permease